MRNEDKRLEWAQKIIQQELKIPVIVNDDNSAPSMYDLRINLPSGGKIAIEVVGAVDRTFTETWNVGPAKDPLQLSIQGNWSVKREVGCQ